MLLLAAKAEESFTARAASQSFLSIYSERLSQSMFYGAAVCFQVDSLRASAVGEARCYFYIGYAL